MPSFTQSSQGGWISSESREALNDGKPNSSFGPNAYKAIQAGALFNEIHKALFNGEEYEFDLAENEILWRS